MEKEVYEKKLFELISNVGAARSCYQEAINMAKRNAFESADAMIAKGNEVFIMGHKYHHHLLKSDLEEEPKISLLLIHAEDQLMNTETFKQMAVEFIDNYKEIQILKDEIKK